MWNGGPHSFVRSYEGDFLNGYFNGKGTLVFRTGDSFKGQFKNGLVLLGFIVIIVTHS